VQTVTATLLILYSSLIKLHIIFGLFMTTFLKFSSLLSGTFMNITFAALNKHLYSIMELAENATAIALDVSCPSGHL
jgi:hypothetical protein